VHSSAPTARDISCVAVSIRNASVVKAAIPLGQHTSVHLWPSRAQLEAHKAVPSEAMTAEQLRRQHDERWGWRQPQPLTTAKGPADDTVCAGT